MEDSNQAPRLIATYASPHALAPRTRAALVGLGYRVVAAATVSRFGDPSWEPDLRIVDERYFDRLPPEDALPRAPIIVLRGAQPRQWQDARVVGEIPRPATLAALYPLLQQALEEHPRRAARAATQLPARCTQADRRWTGVILSLSAAGCLLRSGRELAVGTELNLLFPLPQERMVSTRARVSRHDGDRVGMVFRSPPWTQHEAIGEFVTTRLAIARA